MSKFLSFLWTSLSFHNYDARLYDPVIGRFISPDTIVPEPFNPQSLNRYTYCLNNPLIYVDPSGHEGKEFDLGDFLFRYNRGGGFGGFGGLGCIGNAIAGGGTNYLGIGLYFEWQLKQAEEEAIKALDDGVDEEGAPEFILPENIEFVDEKGKKIFESMLNDSENARKLIEEIAGYEGTISVQTTTEGPNGHCYPPDENGVVKITLNLDRPVITYQYIESDLAHEFKHAINYLSGYYGETMGNIERDARFQQNFRGWDEELTNAYIKNQIHEHLERPAIRAGRMVDEDLIEKRGIPGFD